MYEKNTARRFRARLADRQLCVLMAVALVLSGTISPSAGAEEYTTSLEQPASVIRNISGPSEKLEITTNSSRILTLDKKIPRVMVANPDLVAVTPLSANQVQISAKKAGVTQVNLWDEDGKIYTVDVYIYGDVKELEHAYRMQFPHSAIKVYRYSGSLVLTGFVDRPDYVGPIMRLAEDYSPKVINNIQVGGVQQVLLKVKIYEISRTKLRALGVDLDIVGNSFEFITDIPSILDGGPTVGLIGQDFSATLDALEQNQLAKIIAEPNIVAVSGRPAKFNSGGRAPYIVSSGLQGIQIDWEEFGTTIDFVPIVLGDGKIRLEVRPSITNIDPTLSINLNGTDFGGGEIPGFTERMVDTAVEMQTGQTFALAGLIQRRTESVNRGLPYLADVPILGVPFRKIKEEVNEIELLIMVTPELVDPMDACEVPFCGPGMGTMSPDNCELYWGGHIEVPNRCNQCGPNGCVPTHGHEPCCPGDPWSGGCGPGCGPMSPYGAGTMQYNGGGQPIPAGEPIKIGEPTHGELVIPPAPHGAYLPRGGMARPMQPVARTAQRQPPQPQTQRTQAAQPSRTPKYVRKPSKPFNPSWEQPTRPQATATDGLIGPVGYDSN